MTRNIKLEQKHYNQIDVWNNYINNDQELTRSQNTISYIPESVRSVLDIGCGNCTVTNIIELPYVIGLDFAKIPLTYAKCRVIQASIDALPIKKNKFDLILLTEVLEHLDEDLFIRAIEEIQKLKSRYLLITVPINENLKIELAKCSVCGNIFNKNHHYRTFNDNWYESIFSDYIIETIGYTSYRIPPNESLHLFIHKLGIFPHSKFSLCNLCGGSAFVSSSIIRYLFYVCVLIDSFIKKSKRIKKPYHQIVLLKLNPLKYD